ncbi:hypothetical protein SPISAL_04770 [Spiribacter salinus M19-40]|uniref:Uncharacterized protein n=1 Tax=Spiribacter salinus M19-40 TaxID=1260251 RepID=R4VNA2_9GAMM|nr:hypothetical protein SPISAL_04770 [Spiribacter salinus M19-40]
MKKALLRIDQRDALPLELKAVRDDAGAQDTVLCRERGDMGEAGGAEVFVCGGHNYPLLRHNAS